VQVSVGSCRGICSRSGRFPAWRGRRKTGGRIPQPLWALAVRLVNTHGVSRAAAVPGLDCHTLKKRFEAAANGRVGFIAREPFQSLRNHTQASGERSR